MSPEERQKLCERLRSTWSTVEEQIKAADEIERLAALVQPDVEPQEIIEARKRIRECTSWHDCQQCSNDEKAISEYEATIAQSDAEPDVWELLNRAWFAIPCNRVELLEEIEAAFAKRALAPPRPDASAEIDDTAFNAACTAFQKAAREWIGPRFANGVRAAIEAYLRAQHDASAELIEAAEWHQQQADNLRQQREAATFPAYYGQDIAMHTECARVMRELAIARAADRSGK